MGVGGRPCQLFCHRKSLFLFQRKGIPRWERCPKDSAHARQGFYHFFCWKNTLYSLIFHFLLSLCFLWCLCKWKLKQIQTLLPQDTDHLETRVGSSSDWYISTWSRYLKLSYLQKIQYTPEVIQYTPEVIQLNYCGRAELTSRLHCLGSHWLGESIDICSICHQELNHSDHVDPTPLWITLSFSYIDFCLGKLQCQEEASVSDRRRVDLDSCR